MAIDGLNFISYLSATPLPVDGLVNPTGNSEFLTPSATYILGLVAYGVDAGSGNTCVA